MRATVFASGLAYGSVTKIQNQLHFLEESASSLRSRMVHVMMSEIVASDGMAGHRADEAFDHSFRRVTQKKHGHAISAIGANRRELFSDSEGSASRRRPRKF